MGVPTKMICVDHIATLKYLSLVLVLLSLVSFPTKAAETLTIVQAVETALEHNPDFLAIRQEVEIARGRKVKADLFNQFLLCAP